MNGAGRTVSLNQRLLLVAAAGIVPLAVAAAIGLWLVTASQFRAAESKSLEVTRLTASAIDIELGRSLATLRALSASPLIDHGDLGEFGLLLRRVHATMPGWEALKLSLPDGTALLDSAVPPGEMPRPLAEKDSLQRVVRERRPVVGHLRQDARGVWAVPLRVPVQRNGELLYVLTVEIRPLAFVDVLRSQKLPPDWTVSVFDDAQRRVARTREHERYLGASPSPSLASMLASGRAEGIAQSWTLEGTRVYTAYTRLPASGWTVAVGIPTAAVEAGAQRALLIYGSGIAASLLLAVLSALYATRRIRKAIDDLRTGAEELGHGRVPELPRTDIREIQSLGRALAASAQMQKAMQAEREVALSALLDTENELRQQVADLQRLHGLTSDLLRLPTTAGRLEAVLRALQELHGASKGLVSLCDAEGDTLHVEAAIGFGAEALQRLNKVCAGEGACGLALQEERHVVVDDTDTDPVFAEYRDLARAEQFRAVHSIPLRSSAGRVLGVIAVHFAQPHTPSERELRLADLCARLCAMVLERARAETLARESERRLEVALDSSTVPFSILAPLRDGSGKIVDFRWDYLNRAAATLLERPAGSVLGQRLSGLYPQAWSAPGLVEAYIAVVEHREVRDFEFQSPDRRRWLHVVATPFNGHAAVWYSDITQRKQQEQALQRADRQKDEFLATLAHELRNPLAPIQHAAEISKQPQATEAQKRWGHEVIGRQVKHMALLLDDLLDVSRITRGKLELRKSRLELRSAIDAALETARPHLEAKRHQLETHVPEQPLYVNADPLRMAQVITNLLTNAARYTEPGGRIALSAGAQDGKAVIEVEDNGIGIAADQLESIFKMFSQARPGYAGGGLGIGLALSRGIAELHGGTLSASSAGSGRGSRFTFTLPLGEAAAPPAPREAAERRAARGPLSVLVADDNRDAADMLANFLRLNGHEVEVAYDGEQALSAFTQRQPDAAILDIGMPGLSGYEVARRIRAGAAAPALLIALTGWGQARDVANAAGAGFDHHLTKPVDTARLLGLLQPASKVTPLRQRSQQL